VRSDYEVKLIAYDVDRGISQRARSLADVGRNMLCSRLRLPH